MLLPSSFPRRRESSQSSVFFLDFGLRGNDMENFRSPHSIAKRIDAGDGAAEYQRMNVMRAFIGVDDFQIDQVSCDCIFVADAVAAQHIARLSRNFQCLAARIALQD